MKTKKNHHNWYMAVAVVVFMVLGVSAYSYRYYLSPARTVSPQKTMPLSTSDSIAVIWDKQTRQDTVTGKLVAIDWSKATVDNIPYQLRLTIMLGTAGDQTSYYFNAGEVKRITVFKRVGNQEEKISFNELKVGHRITAVQKINLFKGPNTNLLEFKIIKM